MNQQQLNELISAHEIWFEDNSKGSRLELRNIDLGGLNLAGRRLLDAFLEDVDLTGADLHKTSFIYAHMERVLLSEAKMTQAEFSQAEMKDVSFANADLTGSQIHSVVNGSNITFDGAIMDEAFLVKSTFSNSSFKNTSLTFANFKRAYLDKCSFRGANLENADFTHTYLVDVDFRESKVENAVFEQTRMELLHVYGMIGKPAILEGCSVGNIDFSEAGDNSDIRLLENECLIFGQTSSV